jgi:hypothetical protein
VTQLAISLIKNRRQDTYGSRLKFVSGSQSESGGARASRPPRSASSPNAPSASENSNVREPSPAPEVIGETPMTATGTVALPNPTKTALPNQEALPETSLVRIIGEPTTPNEAATLAEEDKFQFQWWALGLVGTRPVEQKKGADHGIDGKILFRDDPKAAKPEQIIIQVKGGKTGVKDVRDLRGVLDREKAAIAHFDFPPAAHRPDGNRSRQRRFLRAQNQRPEVSEAAIAHGERVDGRQRHRASGEPGVGRHVQESAGIKEEAR